MSIKNQGKTSLTSLTILFFIFTLLSCRKDSAPPVYSKATFNVNIQVGSSTLEWDTIKYLNAAGNPYGVSSINFYISNISLKQPGGTVYTSNEVFYIDPSLPSKSAFHLDSIPPGVYTEISFLMGLDADKNKTHALDATVDNMNMAWPDMMGGGYHFLKLEGHYLDTVNATKGFAIHLGKNENLVSLKLACNMKQEYWDHDYSLIFSLNEIFANPYTYNFNSDQNYTMSDSIAMNRIKNNATDAFSLLQNK